jgi:hypothetical protein
VATVMTWLPIFTAALVGFTGLFGTWLGSRLTRSKDEQQWLRDRRLEAYAEVLQGYQVAHNAASQLVLNVVSDEYSAKLRLVHEAVLQLYHGLNRTTLLATPEMRDTCKELSAMLGRIVSNRDWEGLAGDKAGALVARFTVQAENDLAAGSRMKPKLHTLWRHLLTRSR